MSDLYPQIESVFGEVPSWLQAFAEPRRRCVLERVPRSHAHDGAAAERLRDGYELLAEALLATCEVVQRHNAIPGNRQLTRSALRLEAVRVLEDRCRSR